MLVVVAATGLIIGLGGRNLTLERQARFHDEQAQSQAHQFYYRAPFDESLKLGGEDQARLWGMYRARARWHWEKAQQYRRAIWRPWLQVKAGGELPPDPEPHLPLAPPESTGGWSSLEAYRSNGGRGSQSLRESPYERRLP